MVEKKQYGCCSDIDEKSEKSNTHTTAIGEYVCYCNKVTENDIISAIKDKGAVTVDEVIKITGAMLNSNCKVNNPKGVCCYKDILQVFNKHINKN